MSDEALRALYDIAQRCEVCEDHIATREGESTHRHRHYRVCDDADCGDVIACADCGDIDCVVPLDGWYCAQCGGTTPRREPRAVWHDAKHAAALRAAQAAHGTVPP